MNVFYYETTHYMEICVLLRYYAAFNGNSLPKPRDNLTSVIFNDQESLDDAADVLSRNVGKEFPLYAA